MAAAYGPHPYSDGNCNTYLAHGLARAGLGALGDDWFVGTTDPFPIFSAIVWATWRIGGPALFYAWYAALLGIYLIALRALFTSTHGLPAAGPRAVAFAACVLVVSSRLFRAGVALATGGDWGWYLQSGVAQHSLLGYLFQPSLFGVLLVASLAAWGAGRERLALLLGAASV